MTERGIFSWIFPCVPILAKPSTLNPLVLHLSWMVISYATSISHAAKRTVKHFPLWSQPKLHMKRGFLFSLFPSQGWSAKRGHVFNYGRYIKEYILHGWKGIKGLQKALKNVEHWKMNFNIWRPAFGRPQKQDD